jgi:hypothetical protein
MKEMKLKLSLFCVVLLLFGAAPAALGDWDVGDPNKMHWPQTPKAGGLDIEFSSSMLGDDWRCSETGLVSDIHFWVSWMDNQVQPINNFIVQIYSDKPANPQDASSYSEPNDLLWGPRLFGPGDFAIQSMPNDLQGWFDPSSGSWLPDNHDRWDQINVTDINNPFIQKKDEIYWLVINFGTLPFIGWKETDKNFNDDSVWWDGAMGEWKELKAPPFYEETIDLAFVITGEPLPEKKAYVPHTKWSQPPIEIDPCSDVPTYCGWDEESHNKKYENDPNMWKIVADDYRCIGSMPVTSIHWWGSFYDWEWPVPPETVPPILPDKWWIGFWSNVPALAPPFYMSYSYPDILLHEITIDNSRVYWDIVGKDEYYGYYPNDICFQYNIDLEHGEYFWQDRFRGDTTDDIYWISIVAEYNDFDQPYYRWGWKTRPWHWMDDAVTFNMPYKPPVGSSTQPPGSGLPDITPIVDPEWEESMDMSFELDTDPNWIKWEQLYTGIRDWPHYEDEVSMLDGESTDPLAERLVLDDWLCKNKRPIDALSWFGSYIGYGSEACSYPPFMPLPVPPDGFQLTIWTDVNSTISTTGFSHPNEPIWSYFANIYDEVLVGYDKHPHGEPNEPVFRYSVRLPEEEWFRQLESDTIFWLGVQAIYNANRPNYPWGWTNHEHVYNDNAVSGQQDLTGGGWIWEELYDQNDASEDMSFILFAGCCPGDSDNDGDYDLNDYYTMQGNLAYADFLISGGAGTDYLITPGDPIVGFLWNPCEDWDGDGDVDINDYYSLQGALAYADYLISGGLGTDYLVTPGDPLVGFLWQCP